MFVFEVLLSQGGLSFLPSPKLSKESVCLTSGSRGSSSCQNLSAVRDEFNDKIQVTMPEACLLTAAVVLVLKPLARWES